jgi:serine/threonine-protein kinase SRK2
VFLTPQYLGIAMEFAPGGDMFEYVVKKNGLREDEARWFFQQLIVGLDYCHKMVRVHAGVVRAHIGIQSSVIPPYVALRCA